MSIMYIFTVVYVIVYKAQDDVKIASVVPSGGGGGGGGKKSKQGSVPQVDKLPHVEVRMFTL